MKKIMILSLLIFLVLLPLVKADILTDKYLYKPGDAVIVNLVYTEPLKNVEVKITNPNGNLALGVFDRVGYFYSELDRG